MAGSVKTQDAKLEETSTLLPADRGVHFFKCVGHCAETTANCVAQFSMMLSNMDIEAVKFYYQRGDFQNWIKDNAGEPELLKRINQLGTEHSGENLKKELLSLIQNCAASLTKRCQT